MKLWWLLVVSSLLIPALAQFPEKGHGDGGGTGTVLLSVSTEGGFSGVFGIKGLPFSADTIHETDQVLADGNRIHRETHGKIARDSEGRTRTEEEFTLANGGIIHRIQIYDPVAGTMSFLDEKTKTAIVSHFGEVPERIVNQGTEPNPVGRMAVRKNSLDSEDLGNMTIEGFNTTGSRYTRSIAAGEIGNEQPIIVTNETWYSMELKTPLLTKQDDPRMGQRTSKLVNIRAGEPDPSLFQVPADYTIKDNSPQK